MCIPCSALNRTVKMSVRISYKSKLYTNFTIKVRINLTHSCEILSVCFSLTNCKLVSYAVILISFNTAINMDLKLTDCGVKFKNIPIVYKRFPLYRMTFKSVFE